MYGSLRYFKIILIRKDEHQLDYAWQITLTKWAISSPVKVRYYNVPTRFQCNVGSTRTVPSETSNWIWDFDGVGAGLQASIYAFLSNSLIYLDWCTSRSPLSLYIFVDQGNNSIVLYLWDQTILQDYQLLPELG